MSPVFFSSPSGFRQWLELHHNSATEILVGFYKKGTGKPTLTWSESVDEALCFGWIDGVRRSIDAEIYSIRFTPRKPKSIWSAVNIKKMEMLTKEGRMTPAGSAAFEKRDAARSAIYSFEQENVALGEEFEKTFREHPQAWEYFQSCPPSYRKVATWWVTSAKGEVTRIKRLQELIHDSTNGQYIKNQRWGSGPKRP